MQVPAGDGACYPMGCFFLGAPLAVPSTPSHPRGGGVTNLQKNPPRPEPGPALLPRSRFSQRFGIGIRDGGPSESSPLLPTKGPQKRGSIMRIGLWDALRFPGTYHTGAYGRLPAFPRSTPPSNQPGGWVFPYGHTHSRGTEIPPPPPPSPPLHQASEGKERNWGRRGIKGAPIRGGRGRGSPGTRSPPSHPKKRGRGGAPPLPSKGWAPSHTNLPSAPARPRPRGPPLRLDGARGWGGARPRAPPRGSVEEPSNGLRVATLPLICAVPPGILGSPGMPRDGKRAGGGGGCSTRSSSRRFSRLPINRSIHRPALRYLPMGLVAILDILVSMEGHPPPRTPEGLRTCPSVGEGEGGLVGLTGDPSPSFPDIRWGGRGPGAKGTGRGTTTRGWPFTIPFRCG